MEMNTFELNKSKQFKSFIQMKFFTIELIINDLNSHQLILKRNNIDNSSHRITSWWNSIGWPIIICSNTIKLMRIWTYEDINRSWRSIKEEYLEMLMNPNEIHCSWVLLNKHLILVQFDNKQVKIIEMNPNTI